jgi:Malectin domain
LFHFFFINDWIVFHQYYNSIGERIFDVKVEGNLAISNLDIFAAAGGFSTAYVASILTTVTDGFASIEFIPVRQNPTVSAIEVIMIVGNGTVTPPLITEFPVASPIGSASPTLNIDGQAVAECSVYPACVASGFTGNCCPPLNGLSLPCCYSNLSPSTLLDRNLVDVAFIVSFTATALLNELKYLTFFVSLTPNSSNISASSIPSNAPTLSISSPPSSIPTLDQSDRLSSSPTTFVAMQPSLASSPSANETLRTPSSRLYEFDETRISVSEVKMILGRNIQAVLQSQSLDSNCTQLWKKSIQERIQSEVASVIQRYETLSVDLQNVTRASNISALSITFDVNIMIRSGLRDLDASRYIKGPFDSQNETNAYIQYLESTGCPEFVNITTVEIIVVVENTMDDGPSDSEDMMYIGLIVGVAAAGCAMLVVAFTIICIRMRNRRRVQEVEHVADASVTVKDKGMTSTPSEIDQANGDTEDISTLGDPFPSGTHDKNDVDMATVGSTSLEYDYNRAFADVESVSESYTCESTAGDSYRQSVANPDDLLSINDIMSATGDMNVGAIFPPEIEYNIMAPPGMLGLILETSTADGRPMVNNIRPSSVLADTVMVGDRLVSVDGEDVSAMTASNVSQIIASRQAMARVLIFKRRIHAVSNGSC